RPSRGRRSALRPYTTLFRSPGSGRLALESGAPVVPVAILGSYQVRNWKKLQFPKVLIQYGDPFRFEVVDDPDRNLQQLAADSILDRKSTRLNSSHHIISYAV